MQADVVSYNAAISACEKVVDGLVKLADVEVKGDNKLELGACLNMKLKKEFKLYANTLLICLHQKALRHQGQASV